MTEKEKSHLGQLYNPMSDPQLLDDLGKSKALCLKYNRIPYLNFKKKNKILKKLLGNIKGDAFITAPFWCDYGYNISVGENFYANHNCIMLDTTNITFGDNVLLAPNCCFSTAGHPIDPDIRKTGLEFAKPITIGNNVWFGAGVIVLPGVTIGDNCVIGAGSVVTSDIPSGVVAVGVPCKPVREITSEDKIRY